MELSLWGTVGRDEALHLRGAVEGRAILSIGHGIEISLDHRHVAALHEQAGTTLRVLELVAVADERLDAVSGAAAYARTAAGEALRQAESADSAGAHDEAERMRVAARAAVAAADAADAAVEAAVEAMSTAEDATAHVTTTLPLWASGAAPRPLLSG